VYSKQTIFSCAIVQINMLQVTDLLYLKKANSTTDTVH